MGKNHLLMKMTSSRISHFLQHLCKWTRSVVYSRVYGGSTRVDVMLTKCFLIGFNMLLGLVPWGRPRVVIYFGIELSELVWVSSCGI